MQELTEVYPNKGESKKDFIARFMSATKDEYPDTKQRFAVCMSYWDRRKKHLKEGLYSNTPRKGSTFITSKGNYIWREGADHPELIDILDLDSDAEDIVDEKNWIRADSGLSYSSDGRKASFIHIPLKKITPEQFEALEKWLEICEGDVFQIETSKGDWVQLDMDYYGPNDIINKVKYYYNQGVLKENLTEATRSSLISKSKKADLYANGKGNRWTRKSKCNVANTVKEYNQIDMNTFWKEDILQFTIKVTGETNTYNVGIEFDNILNKIQSKVKANNNELNLNIIYNALIESLNSSDIKLSCDCPDYNYRLKYYASKQGYNKGADETRKSEKTNPDDTKGAGCKHILAILNNLEWLRKIASVINNYISYCKDNMEYNYGKFIFPKIYGMTYNKAVEQSQDETLKSDIATINLSNALGKIKGRIKPGSNKNPAAKKN